ncbi:MAG: hypothetical protein RR874_20120 [Aeromonas sp.]|uniref:hypothetical protein n=1 Tax=Aeromonas sp. TaxID=647 RepID=UPI002FC8E6FE
MESETNDPTKYPEWVRHVGLGYQDGSKNVAWCGTTERPFFQDASHAALNGRDGGHLVACPECVKEIHKALCNGISFGDDGKAKF